MRNLIDIRFSGYLSFENEAALENIKNVNLIIGKNNSGKTNALYAVKCALNSEQDDIPFPKKLSIKQKITDDAIKKFFDKSISVGSVGNFYDYGRTFVNSDITYDLVHKDKYDRPTLSNIMPKSNILRVQNCFENVAEYLYDSITDKIGAINAERNIMPEEYWVRPLSANGDGATSVITYYLTNSKKDESIVEKQLLDTFNYILGEDAHFEAIKIQQNGDPPDDNRWEIFLIENDYKIPLSNMGSGLKTILLVLINLIICQQEDSSKTFLFEELENNLHPALQRRLFDFIYDFAVKNDLTVFISSHSHVAINCFFNKEFANIYHVEKQDGKSTIKKIENYLDKVAILDDLDVRASDLLQSNGIIWVEGPSDRVYIKTWIDLLDSHLKENEHYQFVYYGGKLLSHYTANDEKELINILLTNRNSAIVIDSDKRSQTSSISYTKTRIKKEFEDKGLLCWITKGKEIENYLSANSVNKYFSSNLPQIKQYELFPEYIKKQYGNFADHKVSFANEIVGSIDESDLSVLDLKQQMKKLIQQIKKWNHMQ